MIYRLNKYINFLSFEIECEPPNETVEKPDLNNQSIANERPDLY